MSVQVSIDTSELDSYIQDLRETFAGTSSFLVGYLEENAIPALQSEAASARNVRTGAYAGDWEAVEEPPDSAAIITDAFYWIFLEDGTNRGIKAVPVVGKVATDLKDALPEEVSKLVGIGL